MYCFPKLHHSHQWPQRYQLVRKGQINNHRGTTWTTQSNDTHRLQQRDKTQTHNQKHMTDSTNSSGVQIFWSFRGSYYAFWVQEEQKTLLLHCLKRLLCSHAFNLCALQNNRHYTNIYFTYIYYKIYTLQQVSRRTVATALALLF